MAIKKRCLVNNIWLWLLMFLLLTLTLVVYFFNTSNRKPILIGLSAQLTGKQSELGVQERNGVQLAFEKINSQGGILKREIHLIVRDDLGFPQKAQEVDRELINLGVSAIIGHSTTAQTLSGLKVTNPGKMIVLSPTVSTPKLSDLDDYFIRVYPSFRESAQAFAQYTVQSERISRMTVIYDIDNVDYSETYAQAFQDEFVSIGGRIADKISFSSKAQPDFSHLLQKSKRKKTEGLLIIASDIDTALIAQNMHLIGWKLPLFTSAWAQTNTLINSGGEAVEGLKLVHSYALSSKTKAFTQFVTDYSTRFGDEPSFGAAFGYEAAMVLAAALERCGGKPSRLKQALLETRNFQGLTDEFSIDDYGDVDRPFYLSTVRQGKFLVLQKLAITQH